MVWLYGMKDNCLIYVSFSVRDSNELLRPQTDIKAKVDEPYVIAEQNITKGRLWNQFFWFRSQLLCKYWWPSIYHLLTVLVLVFTVTSQIDFYKHITYCDCNHWICFRTKTLLNINFIIGHVAYQFHHTIISSVIMMSSNGSKL